MGKSDNTELTAEQAAEELGYHVNHVYRLLAQGKMRGRQFNRVWMIEQAEVTRVKALQDDHGRLPRDDRA